MITFVQQKLPHALVVPDGKPGGEFELALAKGVQNLPIFTLYVLVIKSLNELSPHSLTSLRQKQQGTC